MKDFLFVLTALLPLIHADPQRTVNAPSQITARPIRCGFGINGPLTPGGCPADYSCSLPRGCGENNDCNGTCVRNPRPSTRPPPANAERPCGFKIAPCPTGQSCSRTDPTCTRGENCAGLCVPHYSNPLPPLPPITDSPPKPTRTSVRPPQRTYPSCGGFRIQNEPCPAGSECMDDPRRSGCGMACDAPGICVPTKQPYCAGFIGSKCPVGLTCYDDPREDCDPQNGGADCIGICL